MGTYKIRNAQLDVGIDYLNLSNRSINALKRSDVFTVQDLLDCTVEQIYRFRNLGSKSVEEIVSIQRKIEEVLSGECDLNEVAYFYIFCILNRDKIIHYFSEHCDLPVSDLPLSVQLINRLRMNGYKTLSQIIMTIPEESDISLYPTLVEEILSISRYYLREQKEDLMEYCLNIQSHDEDQNDNKEIIEDKNQFIDKGEEGLENSLNTETNDNQSKSYWAVGTPVTYLNLSNRITNALMRNKIDTIDKLLLMEEEDLNRIRGLGRKSIQEILTFIQNNRGNPLLEKSSETIEALEENEFNSELEEYIKMNDFPLSSSSLSKRSKNALAEKGYYYFSELKDFDPMSLESYSGLGKTSINEIKLFIYQTNRSFKAQFSKYYVDGHYTSEYIEKLILLIYRDAGFKGFSYRRIKERLPESFRDEEIKQSIGKLIAADELEYVEYRCYKKYPSFFEFMDSYFEQLNDSRIKQIITEKYAGKTLEAIGNQLDITRERVRQVFKKESKKMKDALLIKTGYAVFDEDYYQYLWQTYSLGKDACINYLGIPEKTFYYLKETYNHGISALQDAVNDENIDTALKLRIISYLNKDKIEIDGQLVNKKRSEIEEFIISKYCKEDTHIDDFFILYNGILEKNGIPYDTGLYIEEEIQRSRSLRIADKDFCLWKEGQTFRYYNIRQNDYTDLLDVLNLPSYKNTEISTLKFVEEYPELMKAYDIHDQYELHNLLRKIVDPSTCNNLDFHRTPVLRFGEFDRDKEIFELISAFSPISQKDLVEYIHDEYGHSEYFIAMNVLSHFSQYLHRGIYSVDFQRIPEVRIDSFQNALTDDFYYLTDLRKIYTEMFEGADENDINPYTLKGLGFTVNSNYAIQHYDNAMEYFTYLIMKNDVYDISDLKQQYGALSQFGSVYYDLKKSFDIFEFDHNQIITINRLQKLNINKEDIQRYIDEVYEFVEDMNYFTISSIRNEGFSSELDDLGLKDDFYWGILSQDERFNARRTAGTAILAADTDYTSLSAKSFILDYLEAYDSIDTQDLLEEIYDEYGIQFVKQDILDAVRDTDKYYDSIMDKVYRNKKFYYEEFED